MAEAWIELNISSKGSPDLALLREVVEPLVHVEFADDIETWHFFWEPALRLRLRWSEPSRQAELEARLEETLNRWKGEGRLDSWAAGNHGVTGERHRGEADSYGPELWGLIQKEWEHESELALHLLELNEVGGLTGELTSTLEAHWGRHVHLYTNRIFGHSASAPRAAEILLCLAQARGYLQLAIQELSGWDEYVSLVHSYTQMEKHADAALRIWDERRERAV